MKIRLLPLFLLSVLAWPAVAADSGPDWSRSIVTLEASRKTYQYLQPWTRQSVTSQKFGLVIDSNRILTTAAGLNDLSIVRVQKSGRGQWYMAQLDWIDYHANLAVVSCDEEGFWDQLEPAQMMEDIPLTGEVQLLRWREGKLEPRRMEINRPVIRTGEMTFIDLLALELDGDVDGIGRAEPLVKDGRVVGLISSGSGNGGHAIPAPFMGSVLEERADGGGRTLGFFNFYWQRAENPASLLALGWEEERGVIVIQPLAKLGEESILKARDVILEIDGFEIDQHGDYRDPIYGTIMLEAIATRNHWAGDSLPMKIWRDKELIEIDYVLPKAEFEEELIPDARYDQPPEYLIAGGFVFQPLTVPYLQTWGGNWQQQAPFRLSYLKQAKPDDKRNSIVILSLVLPDPYNLGYQNNRYLVVDKINDTSIATLEDVAKALESPPDGFHVIRFAQGDSPGKVVLDAGDLESATQRVLQRYGIQSDRFLGGAEEN